MRVTEEPRCGLPSAHPPPKKIAIRAYGAFGQVLGVPERKTLYTKQEISMQKPEVRSQKSELMRERRGKHHTKTEVVVVVVEDDPVPRPAANI